MENNQTNPNIHQPTPTQPTPEQQQRDKFKDLHYHRHDHYHGHWFGHLFWGMIIIMIGLAFLARSLGYVTGFEWGQFFSHVWPVLIIFLGLSILSRAGIFARIIRDCCTNLLVKLIDKRQNYR